MKKKKRKPVILFKPDCVLDFIDVNKINDK